MLKNEHNLYAEAHLFVAAIRVLSHTQKTPPALDQVCRHLVMSLEQGGVILRKLQKEDIVEVVEQAHGNRLFIKAHLNIEKFRHAKTQSALDKAMAEFKSDKETMSEKIAAIRADQARKKKDLFAQLENQLKKEADARHP